MVSVNTNIAALGAQNNLKMNNFGYEKAMQRLSSGKRINGAADDAAGLSVASSMTAQVKGLKMASKNASDGISLVNTIEGALNEATDILQRMRELAVQSISDTNNGSDRTYIQDEINQLNNELNRISSTTQYNGMNVLDGTFTDQTMQIGNLANQTLKFGVASIDTTTLGAYERDSVVEMTTATDSAAVAIAGLKDLYSADADYVLAGSFGTKTAFVDAGASARDVAAAFNLIKSETNISATATTRATLAFAATGSASFTLQGKSSTASTVTATVDVLTDQTALRDAINAVSGATGITATLSSDKSTVNMVNSEGYNIVVGDFTGVDGTMNDLDKDGAANGGTITLTSGGNDSGAVSGAIKLTGDKPYTVTPSDTGNHFSTASAALTSSLVTLGDISLKTVLNATNAVAVIDMSLAMVAASRSKMGAIQNRLTSTVENLSSVITKTQASLSQIQDANFAGETTELSKSQILTQAAQAMLAQANQANQGVLRLLQAA